MANGATQAVENATRLSEIGFPQFTAQLITDTFNAITTSYMEQMAQYIGVVQAVSQTLQDYINNTADDISADEIGAFLLGIAGLNDDALNFLLGDSTARRRLERGRGDHDQQCRRLAPAAGPSTSSSVFRQSQQIKKTNDRAGNRASHCKQQIRSFADDGSSGRASSLRGQWSD